MGTSLRANIGTCERTAAIIRMVISTEASITQ
jgi:hypothetical protein